MQIAVCPVDQTDRALEILFADLPDEERQAMIATLRLAVHNDAASREGLLVALEDHAVCGAVLVQLQAGDTALLWPPSTRPPDRQQERALAHAADEYAAECGSSMAQALFTTPDDPRIAALESVGFQPLTALEYLIAVPRPAPLEGAPHGFELEPYRASERSRLAAVIEATYVETHDCPQLDGAREIDDVITGYQATGAFDPARWFFACRDGRDVGVLLLTEYEDTCQWELVYMGVVPDARHQGIGKALVNHALGVAHDAGVESLLLAVDAANRDAVRLYRRCGFRVWNRRFVYWKRYA